MIAVDTNILVYAHRSDAASHGAARRAILRLLEAAEPWAIAWPSIHEFIAVVTNARIYKPATTIDEVFEQIRALTRSNVVLLHETSDHLNTLAMVTATANATGGRIHDARIAAICMDHGVTELWTADRDFQRFPALATRNPLV